MIPEIPWETCQKRSKWASSAEWLPHLFTHEYTRKVSRNHDIICDPAEVHACLCKSLTLPWWMTLTVIKSPTNPCGVWQSFLGANEGFQEPLRATRRCFCRDTSEILCACEVCWKSFPYPTSPSYLHFQSDIYDQLNVNHRLIRKHMPAGKLYITPM